MARTYEELMHQIVTEHGIALGSDDPILVMHTLNRYLATDLDKAVQAQIAQLKADLEDLYHRWEAESKAKAERILGAAISASEERMAHTMEQAARAAAAAIRQESEAAQMRLRNLANQQRAVGQFLVAVMLVLIAAIGFAAYWFKT